MGRRRWKIKRKKGHSFLCVLFIDAKLTISLASLCSGCCLMRQFEKVQWSFRWFLGGPHTLPGALFYMIPLAWNFRVGCSSISFKSLIRLRLWCGPTIAAFIHIPRNMIWKKGCTSRAHTQKSNKRVWLCSAFFLGSPNLMSNVCACILIWKSYKNPMLPLIDWFDCVFKFNVFDLLNCFCVYKRQSYRLCTAPYAIYWW